METTGLIGTIKAAVSSNSEVDIELIAAGVAIIGGVASAVLWISAQLSDIKEKLGVVKMSVEVNGQRVEALTMRVNGIEENIEFHEAESDRRLEVLEEEVMILFNYLVSLYKLSGETINHTDDVQSFLENCILSYVVESDQTTINKRYKRGRDKCLEDMVEEIRQLVSSFTYAKVGNSSNIK